MSRKPVQKWKIGDVKVSKIVESETEGFLEHVIIEASPEALLGIPWLQPDFVNPQGYMRWSMHALVIETPTRRIIVDTCVGNDKTRPSVPPWHLQQLPFLEDLEHAGFARDSIDTVLCTHLHVDHVGWNTMLVEGRWVPTFPKARYLFGRTEFEHWQADAAAPAPADLTTLEAFQYGMFADSVKPVVDAGLVELVATDHRVCDEVRLTPTPGHTPGHVSIVIESGGATALITGDFIHHPCQLAHPEWPTIVDTSREQSSATRNHMFSKLSGTPTLVIGTHWASPTAGRIIRDGTAFPTETVALAGLPHFKKHTMSDEVGSPFSQS